MPDQNYTRRIFFQKLSKLVHIPELPLEPQALEWPETEPFTLNGDLSPYNGVWSFAQPAQILRRTSFGTKKAQVEQLLALGNANAAVDFVLNLPAQQPLPPINNYNNPEYTDPVVAPGETWITAPPDFDNGGEGYRIESWRGWWLNLMIEGDPNIREKMTLFWHNHFATQTSQVFIGRLVYQYNQLLRENCLGNFKQLTRDITLNPMMLIYLNGYFNDKSAPDENYARELQELFTVGKDGPSQYTEADVVAAARVLTGWRINPVSGDVYFDFNAHDTGTKVFSAFYNNTNISGSINGDAELSDLLNMIFAKEEVSKHLCRKLYRFFLYYKIDQTVEDTIIAPLAQILRDNNYNVQPVLATLFKSQHFFDAYNTGCFIKTPLDQMVGVLRNFNQSIQPSTLLDGWKMPLYLNYTANSMQMLPGDPPNVAGWAAFRQSPAYYRNWITGDTIRNRNVFSDVMVYWYYETDNDRLSVDCVAFAAQFDHPEDPVQLVNDALQLMLPVELSATKKFLLKSILLSGQTNDQYWTNAWNSYANDPGNPMTYETVKVRLTLLCKYIMSLPEYQLA